MEIISSFRREGREQGRREGCLEGKREILTYQTQNRLGSMSDAATGKLDKLTSRQLNALAVELLSIQSISEVEEWLSKR